MSDTTNTSVSIEKGAKQKAIPLIVEADLRDYFAAKAMQAWLSTYAENDRHPASAGNLDHFAGQAYEVADAMLAARTA